MMARFGADGQLCEMTLEKREKTDTGILFGSFSEKEVRTPIIGAMFSWFHRTGQAVRAQ